MDLLTIAMLLVAGVIGGVLSSMVGGASLITFPAFLAAGVPPVIAAASNQAAVLPANIAASLSDRSLWPPLNRAFLNMLIGAIMGTIFGSVLLLVTPERLFEILVPLLLLSATVLFAISPRIVSWLRARATAQGRTAKTPSVTSLPLLMPVAIYLGYFGAGVGVLLLAVFSISTEGNYREANVIKNIVSSVTTAAAVVYFAVAGAIDWPPTLIMAAGALAGGALGGQLAKVAPPAMMRMIVIVVGALLTAAYAWRYWF